jgi:hypothetical protein
MPSRMSLILGVQMQELEKVVYFAGYVITEVNETKRKEYIKLLDEEYKKKVENVENEEEIEKIKNIFSRVKKDLETIKKYSVVDELVHSKYSQKFPGLYEAGIGAEAVYELIKKVDLKKLEQQLVKEISEAPALEKKKLEKRISVVRAMLKSGVKAE